MEEQTEPNQTPLPGIEDIQQLVAFLPRLYREGFQPVEKWEGGVRQKDGSYTVPYPAYQPEVLAFYQTAAQAVWMDFGYQPDEAWKMLSNPHFVANASLAQIKTMLTFCVRGERFSDGHWAAMIEQGHIRHLLERLSVLKDQTGSTAMDK